MNDQISKSKWNAPEALVRFSLIRTDEAWASKELFGAELENARRVCTGLADEADESSADRRRVLAWMKAVWPDAGTPNWGKEMHPLAWIRWVYGKLHPVVASKLLRVVSAWDYANVAQGKFVAVRGKSSGSRPSLKQYGVSGHGWPVLQFILADANEIDLNEDWKTKTYQIGLKLAASVAPPSVKTPSTKGRSRGKGVENAVEAGLLAYFIRDNTMQRLNRPNLDDGPRYQVDNISREELEKKIRWRCEPLKDYSATTVIAELSRWVKFPRGRPAHR